MNENVFFIYFGLLIFAFILALTALSFSCFYKIRKVHLATYLLQEDVSVSRREIENLFAQIQALLALERKLGLSEALPAMRGWAGSPDFLLVLTEELIERKPNCVLECSSGISTLVVARCLQKNGNGHVFSLEHDSEYAKKTQKLLYHYGLSDWATVIYAPLKTNLEGVSWYAEDAIPVDLPPIEMLIVDGPPTSIGPLARFPALPRLSSKLSQKYMVILDDANRKDEIEMVVKWMELFPKLTKQQRFCEKGLVCLYS